METLGNTHSAYIDKKRMDKVILKIIFYPFSSLSGGADGTRTRDPLRDRQVF